MYYYIEVYAEYLEVTVYGLTKDWHESKVLETVKFNTWHEFLNSEWYAYEYECSIPMHISPDLFSDVVDVTVGE